MRRIGSVAVLLVGCSLLANCTASASNSATTIPVDQTATASPAPTPVVASSVEELPMVSVADLEPIPQIVDLPPPTAESMAVDSILAPHLFGPEYKSIYVYDKARIYTIPERHDDNLLGRLPKHAYVVPVESLTNDSCKYEWLRIRPMGWICSTYKLSDVEPTTSIYPQVYKPGHDGRVYKDEADVLADGGYIPDTPPAYLRKSPIEIDGRVFYKTRTGELVEGDSTEKFWGAVFEGTFMDEADSPKLPIAWTWNDGSHTRPTKVFAERDTDSEVIRELPLRSVVHVVDADRKWVQVEDGFIRRKDTRIAFQAEEKAEGVATDDEIWVSIELDEQTLIAYRGLQPVFATLISGGRWKFPTPKGTFRITKKTALTSMVSPKWSPEQYAVGNVPWVAHISKLYALHGAWWHYGFGIRMSHGCVNMSTVDAREVYNLLEPQVPDGWWEKYATDSDPGSVIYIYKRSSVARKKAREKRKKKDKTVAAND
jgi:lipoprotein-anchoring transpeptidase ErfK/SrfK